MKRILGGAAAVAAGVALAASGALLTAGAASASTGTPASAAAVPAASGACATGDFCLYSEQNQTGSKCSWSSSTINTHTSPECSWLASGSSALSDANNTPYTVTMWVGSNYAGQRIGSSSPGGAGNFTIPWKVGSLRFS